MENEQLKIRVKQASVEEISTITAQTIAKLETASVGQLQASLAAIAEAFIDATAECPDLQTKYGLAMAFLSQTLDENAGVVSLQNAIPLETMEPPTGATN